MQSASTARAPTILFGAFDRHNFGDLLFPHIAAALLPDQNLIFAGLAQRDLRPFGGHEVKALGQIAAKMAGQQANFIHVGGELLTCETWQAAVMLLPPGEAQATIARLDAHPPERLAWAQDFLGYRQRAPYVAPAWLGHDCRVIYAGVGGVELASRDADFQAEIEAKLKTAAHLGVRDKTTLSHLAARGVEARLMPDPAVMVAALFNAEIEQHGRSGETARILAAFPQGYIAVQFSADFGDDVTLTEIAAQLDQVSRDTGLGVVFFRAGAAPWHDELDGYQRTAARMRSPAVKHFTSLHLWDICALIANSRAYCGSSLHGRIVATAFARPRINLRHPSETGSNTKQVAYASTWEAPGLPLAAEVDCFSRGIHQAMAAKPEILQHTASELANAYLVEFALIHAQLTK